MENAASILNACSRGPACDHSQCVRNFEAAKKILKGWPCPRAQDASAPAHAGRLSLPALPYHSRGGRIIAVESFGCDANASLRQSSVHESVHDREYVLQTRDIIHMWVVLARPFAATASSDSALGHGASRRQLDPPFDMFRNSASYPRAAARELDVCRGSGDQRSSRQTSVRGFPACICTICLQRWHSSNQAMSRYCVQIHVPTRD